MGNGENLMELKVYDQIDELIRENKRLKKLADDLQREITEMNVAILDKWSHEQHPMEDK